MGRRMSGSAGSTPGRPVLVRAQRVDERFSLLTNHGQALLCLLREPSLRIRDLGDLIGTSERRAQAIVNDLVDAGLIRRRRVGRRNHYDLPPADEDRLSRPARELGAALDRARTERRRHRISGTGEREQAAG